MRLSLLLAFLCSASAPAQTVDFKPVPRVQAVPMPHHLTSFQLDGRELTAMHFDPQDMRPFWYPIRASKEPSLTRMGHPHDPLTHSHHNSVWIAHNSVNELDFWGDAASKQGRIVTVEISREGYQDSDEAASMRQVNHWIKAADGSVQLIEVRRTEVRPLKGAASWWLIMDLEFTAPAGRTAVFGATGFGLAAVRLAKNLGVTDGGARLLNSAGQLNEKAIFRQPASWCDASGRLTRDADGFAGITLMNHPLNPRHPTALHVRDDGWMGCCLSLDQPLEVSAARPLRVRYGLWVHDGVSTQAECEAQWQAFAALPLAELHADKKSRN